MKDRNAQELIYRHITTEEQSQTVLNDARVEAEHLRALLRRHPPMSILDSAEHLIFKIKARETLTLDFMLADKRCLGPGIRPLR